MPKVDIDALSDTQAKQFLGKARTVTGNNLQGEARIISVAELQKLLANLLRQHGGINEDEIKAREEKLRQDYENRILQLQQRLSELDSNLKQADQLKTQAVQAARQESAARIAELEGIIKNDNARARLAFLEQEVVRLQALIDRYEVGLEVVSAVETPDISPELALAKDLRNKTKGELAERLDYLAQRLEAGKHALTESLTAVNEKGQGHVYAVIDIVERAVSLGHLVHEVRSIKQAMG